jgi:hypothetical protein
MAEQPRRPAFFDGQVLAAATLERGVAYARNQLARHERYLHTVGIVEGLDLETTEIAIPFNAQAVPVKQVTLTAGMAVDGYGREILLPADLRIGEDRFEESVGASVEVDPTAADGQTSHRYPIFLVAAEREAPPPAFSPGQCGGGATPDGVIEEVDVIIGRRGDHLTLADQHGPGVADELGPNTEQWRILIGYLRLHKGLRRFVEANTDPLDDVGRRYAGVRADAVVARSSLLALRAGGTAPAPGKPMALVDEADGGSLQFGVTTKSGGLDPAFVVKANGDVTLRGVLDPGVIVVGSVRVQSGTATDGIRLPLPPGVTEADVSDAKVALHVTVTPRFPFDPNQPDRAFAVARCEVDPDRVVRCRLFEVSPGTSAVPGACDYIVIASAATS